MDDMFGLTNFGTHINTNFGEFKLSRRNTLSNR
jgi:hypothetical protein